MFFLSTKKWGTILLVIFFYLKKPQNVGDYNARSGVRVELKTDADSVPSQTSNSTPYRVNEQTITNLYRKLNLTLQSCVKQITFYCAPRSKLSLFALCLMTLAQIMTGPWPGSRTPSVNWKCLADTNKAISCLLCLHFIDVAVTFSRSKL